VVATARPELLTRRPGWGGATPGSAVVALPALSEKDTAELVGGLLDQARLPAELQRALLARAGGNPLYAEEYVRMLADQGLLWQAGSGWRLDHAAQLPPPATVHGIIAARLDALPAQDKALLQDAAVLGEIGWLGGLAALTKLDRARLEARLRDLERRELVRRERRSRVAGERQYAFRHVLVRDVAYGQLPRMARAERHRRAARWLQALSPDRAEDRAELLAHHWQAALRYAQAAGQDTSALVEPARLALGDAGDRALELNAFAAAKRWYAAALEQWPVGDRRRARLLLQFGRARYWADQAGDELLAEARDLLLAQGDREGAAEAEAMLGLLLWKHGHGERAMAHRRQAVALLDGAAPSPAKAAVLASLTAALAGGGHSAEAIETGRQALAMAEALGLDQQQARTLNYLGWARIDSGDAGGIGDLERAVAVAVRANLPDTVTVYGNLANAVIGAGDLTRGFELQAKALEAAERFGLASDLRTSRWEQISQDYWQGRWDAAMETADQLLAAADAGSEHFMERAGRQMRGLVRLARGDLPGALADAARAVSLAAKLEDVEAVPPALAFRARALLANGQVDEAAAVADELLAELAGRGAFPTNPDWSGDLAIVLRALGRSAELTRLAAAAIPTPWLAAAAAAAKGDYGRAAELYADIGSLPDEAHARLRAGGQLLEAGRRTEGTAQVERALGFYRQVGASAYLREAEALLAVAASP
jgi:hypothetical protein